MLKALAAALLTRALGPERGGSIVGDLEEDLESGLVPRWARVAPGIWLFCQALAYVVADRWAGGRVSAVDRDARRPDIASVWYDLRYAIRTLRSAPTFTSVALLVMALAIGAGTAIFSVVDAVALRPLPYDDPDRLVQIGTRDPRSGAFELYQPPQTFADWQARQTVFAAMAATQASGGFTLDEQGVIKELPALQVTAGYFDVYRVAPQIGRAFVDADYVDGRQRIALISDGLWRRHFGADARVIGRTLRSTAELTYGAPFPVPAGTWTIVGVMPAGFRSPVSGRRQTDVWVPYITPENQRTRAGSRSAPLELSARLADGVAIDAAHAQIETITAGLAEQHPDWFEGARGAVRSLHEATVGGVRGWMLMLLGAVGVVLLIACVSVANLMLARAMGRGAEMQIRAALGASRWRIARGLLLESLVLAVCGSLLGLAVAVWALQVLRAALPEALPRISTAQLDVRVLGVTTLASLVTGLLFGLAPALQLSRRGVAGAVRDIGRSVTAGGMRLRSALVISEIALAVVLTIAAGLFLSSFLRVSSVDVGVDPRNVLTTKVWPRFDPSKPGWAAPVMARSAVAIPEMVDRIAEIPGVLSVGFVGGDLPFTGYAARADIEVPGRDQSFGRGDRPDVRFVTPGYARAVGTPLLRGRYLDASDTSSSAPVVVISEEAAARYLSGRDPLGASLTIAGQRVTVVGVVANVRLYGPERDVRPEAYRPVAQGQVLGGALAVRTSGDPLAVTAAVRNAIRASFPDVPESEVSTLSALLGEHIAQRRFNLLIVGLFGGLALAIASAGLYGVMAYLVTQRTREIGVRVALGAAPRQVMQAVFGRGVAHTAAGVALGLAIAWPLASSIEAFLFEVRPHDPVVYAGAAALLAACGFTAAFVPARRASRVNPIIALRAD